VARAILSRPKWSASMAVLRSPLLAQLGIVHGFTTKALPIPFRSSDRPRGDRPLPWGPLLDAVGAPAFEVAVVEQVHGDTPVRVGALGGPTPAGRGDILLTRVPGVLLCVRVADCVPVLIVAPGAVAAVHAGWRGTALGAVLRAVEALVRETGAAPAEMVAAIGPSIGPCCYETGEEVVEALSARVPVSCFVSTGPAGRPYVDLRAANMELLRSAGVGAVDVIQACTRCDGRFHSYRGDGGYLGQQAGLVGILP
jgi:hypothetical protein